MINITRELNLLASTNLRPCVGHISSVAGMTVESLGPAVGMGELCDIELTNGKLIPAEVVGFHKDRRVLMPLEDIEGVCPNDRVIPRQTQRTVNLGPALLGRVIDGLGNPIDGKGPIITTCKRSLDNTPPAPLTRARITEPLSLGIRAIDGINTVAKGQRIGIFAGSGVGKSTLMGQIARHTEADINVLCLVGERGREVREFIEESLGEEGLARSVVCVATSDSSPIQRVKVPFLALTIAEFFRDQGQNVLMMMDSLTRFAHAQREIGLASGEPPTTKGYCPSVFAMLPKITERMGTSDAGSITGIMTVLVDGDDMNDPVADCVRSLLDGHIVLERKLAEQGHYPAIDILQSVSRLMNSIATDEHKKAARSFKAIYATYNDAEDLINIGAYSKGSNPRIDLAIELIEKIRSFLIQESSDPQLSMDQIIGKLVEITRRWDQITRTNLLTAV